MNIGKGRWHSKYICDKCHEEIPYIEQKGFVGINHYSRATYRNSVYKKSFDLCQNCEKKFRKWLKERELKTALEENTAEAFILKCQITILKELIEEREEK